MLSSTTVLYGCTLWLTNATPQQRHAQHDVLLVKNDIALWLSCTPLHRSKHVPVSNSPLTTLYCNCQEQHYTIWLTLWLSFITLNCRLYQKTCNCLEQNDILYVVVDMSKWSYTPFRTLHCCCSWWLSRRAWHSCPQEQVYLVCVSFRILVISDPKFVPICLHLKQVWRKQYLFYKVTKITFSYLCDSSMFLI